MEMAKEIAQKVLISLHQWTRDYQPTILRISLFLSVGFIVGVFLRYHFIKHKLGLQFDSISLFGITNFTNAPSLLSQHSKDGRSTAINWLGVKKKLTFHADSVNYSFGISSSSPWFRIYISGLVLVYKYKRKIEIVDLNEAVEKKSKSITRISRLLSALGIIYEAKSSFIYLILYPLRSILRTTFILLISKLISIDIENLDIRLLDELQSLEGRLEADRLILGTGMQFDGLNKSNTIDICPILASFIINPFKTIKKFLSLQPSDHVLFVEAITENLIVSGRIFDPNEVNDESPFSKLFQIRTQVKINLQFMLAKISSHLMKPRLVISVETIRIFADSIVQLASFLQLNEVFLSPLNDIIEKDYPDLDRIRLLEHQIKKQIARLMFCEFEIRLNFIDAHICYDLSLKQRTILASLVKSGKDGGRKSINLSDNEDVPGIVISLEHCEICFESARNISTEVADMPDGELKFYFRMTQLFAQISHGDELKSIYAADLHVLCSLDRVELKSSIPFSLVYQCLFDSLQAKLAQTRLASLDVKVNKLCLAFDLLFLSVMLQVVTPFSVAQKSPPSRRERIFKVLYPGFVLLKYALDSKIEITQSSLLLAAFDGESKFDSISIDLNQMEMDIHWDKFQKSNSSRRPSLNEVNEQTQLYFSASAGLNYFVVRMYEIDLETTKPATLSERENLPSIFKLPNFRSSFSATIPGILFGNSALCFVDGFPPEIFCELNVHSSDLSTCLHPSFGLKKKFISSLFHAVKFFERDDETTIKDSAQQVSSSALREFFTVNKFDFELKLLFENYFLLLGSEAYDQRSICLSFESLNAVYNTSIMNPKGVEDFVNTEGSIKFKELQFNSLKTFVNLDDRLTLLRVSELAVIQEKAILRGQDLIGVQLVIEKVSGTYGIYPHLLLWRAMKYLYDCFKMVQKDKTQTQKEIRHHYRRPLPRIVSKIHLQSMELGIILPNNVQIYLNVTEYLIDAVFPDNQVVLRTQNIEILNEIHRKLFSMSELTMMTKIREQLGKNYEIFMKLNSFAWTLPAGFNFASFVDNMSNFVKTIKQLHGQGTTQCSEEPTLPDGNFLKRSQFQLLPTVNLEIAKFDILFEDDPFDAALSRNFLLGLDEQQKRTDRDVAFDLKVAALKDEFEKADEDNVEIETARRNLILVDRLNEARNMLEQANARLWMQKIENWNKLKQKEFSSYGFKTPPLFHVSARNMRIMISAPHLTKPTVEETIHDLDETTPTNTIYDLMFAAQLFVRFHGLQMRIRDFKRPMLLIPDEETTINGLFIVAEPIKDIIKQSRRVFLPINDFDVSKELLDMVSIYRAILPTKLYASLSVKLPSAPEGQPWQISCLNYGVAFEPHLADLNRVFSSLTPTSVDPSDPLPFWDKIRLILHGKVLLTIPKGGAFRVRLTGSRKAHDPGHGNSAGVDLLVCDGVQVKINYYKADESLYTDHAVSEEEDLPEYDQPPISIICGEVIGSVPRGFDQNVKDDIVARLSGGVQLGLRFDFETLKEGTHVDVFTKSPAYAFASNGDKYDSFAGIRSKSIVVNLFLNAPIPDSLFPYHGRNFFSTSQTLIAHFMKFGSVYTSPLTVLPIKRGTIHFPPPYKPPKTQKLSRFVQGVNIQMHLKNLLAGYLHPTEAFSVGVRGKIRDISFALSLEQENFIPGRRGANWEIVAADFDMTDLEIRSVQRGEFPMNNIDEEVNKENVVPLYLDEDHDIDKQDWKFDVEMLADDYDDQEILYPTIWAPRMIYFRHGSDTVFEILDPLTGEMKIPERDVNLMQIALLEKRFDEVTREIEADEEILKGWEDRISLFLDDTLVKQSLAIKEKKELLKEKKVVIQKHIDKRKRQVRSARGSRKSQPHLRNLSVLQGHQRNFPSLASINSPAHIRKPSMVSIKSNQNGQVKRADYLHRFVIHNLSVLWSLQIRNVIFKLIDLEKNAASIEYFVTYQAIKILREMISAASRKSKMGLTFEAQGAHDATGMAQELLEKLLADRKENFVITEDTTEESETKVRDPSDPAYISPEYSIYNDIMFQCFYPQINFHTTGKTGIDGSIIVSAESASIKTSFITDELGDMQTVKSRRIVHLDNAQFYTVFKNDLFVKLGKRGMVRVIEEIPWPVWVPVENLIDSSLPSEEFGKFVNNCQVAIQIDNCSPTYLPSDKQRKKYNQGLSEPHELEHVNTVYVSFPRLQINATSAQYCALYDVIGNLLVYSDPTRKQRLENVGTMLFALSKENLSDVIDLVAQMQDKAQSLERKIQANITKVITKKDAIFDGSFAMKQADLRQKVDILISEILLIMEALKRLISQKRTQDSVKKSHRTVIKADTVSWKLVGEKKLSLCELKFDVANYYTLSYEDRSNIHTIEVDKLTMMNLLPKPIYSELISPYLPDVRQLDFSRHKMLRVYWRELAPVAGISIIDHFEINIFPLLLQLTYDVAKGLIEYFYPKKKIDVVKTYGSNSNFHNDDRSMAESSKTAPQMGSGGLNLRGRSSTISTNKSEVSSNSYDVQSSIQRSRAYSVASVTSSSPTISLESNANEDRNSKRTIIKGLIPVGRDRTYSAIEISDDADAKLMKNRATSNKTFVYIKVPGSTHCLSYHGEKDKNIEDLYRFVLKLPTLEYHNKTWSWLEFVMAVRRDIAMAVVSQTGSLVREKLSIRKRRQKPPKTAISALNPGDNQDDDDDESE